MVLKAVVAQALPLLAASLLAMQAAAPAESASARMTSASAALATGRNAEAAEEFQKVLAIDRTLAAAYAGLGIALGRLGRYPEAVAAFQDGIRVAPHDAQRRAIATGSSP